MELSLSEKKKSERQGIGRESFKLIPSGRISELMSCGAPLIASPSVRLAKLAKGYSFLDGRFGC